MKRFLFLSALFTTVMSAEEAALPRNTVMLSGKSMTMLKAGTVVQVVGHNAKGISVTVDKTKAGTIPLDSFAAIDPAKAGNSGLAVPAPAPAKVAKAPVGADKAPVPAPSPGPGATTNYGKMVEKAKDSVSRHEASMVNPTDEILR